MVYPGSPKVESWPFQPALPHHASEDLRKASEAQMWLTLHPRQGKPVTWLICPRLLECSIWQRKTGTLDMAARLTWQRVSLGVCPAPPGGGRKDSFSLCRGYGSLSVPSRSPGENPLSGEAPLRRPVVPMYPVDSMQMA